MKESLIRFRNATTHFFYKRFFRPIFFKIDPEKTHDRTVYFCRQIGRFFFARKLIQSFFDYKNPVLEQKIDGLSFKNPIGLSAGFDKNGELTDVLPAIGLGFVEIGSITGNFCEGNPKPRLWRLKKSQSLAVHYGLKNDGCEIISQKLKNKKFSIPVGVSVAMTNNTENLNIDRALLDYQKSFTIMEPIANYLTVNISCPNTLGGQPFTKPENLEKLFTVLDKISTSKLIFVKFPPDLKNSEIDELLKVLRNHRVSGIICVNLTKKIENNTKILERNLQIQGGLSGKIVQDSSDRLLKYIYQKEKTRFLLIGCGGVFTAEDAYKKIRLGASLIQMMTGIIFEGPQLVSQINQDLVKLLKKDGFKNIAEAIGVDNSF